MTRKFYTMSQDGWGRRFAHRSLAWLLPAALLAVAQPALATEQSITATVDALANMGGATPTLNDGDVSVTVQKLLPNIDRRGIMEFNISGIPDESEIISAMLELKLVVMTYSETDKPILSLHGYEADGLIQADDLLISASNLIGASDSLTALGPITISLNAAYIESLLAKTNYLGILAVNSTNSNQAGFVTTEGQKIGLGAAPRLVVSYRVVPEPGTASILAIAAVAAGLRRSRRQAA